MEIQKKKVATSSWKSDLHGAGGSRRGSKSRELAAGGSRRGSKSRELAAGGSRRGAVKVENLRREENGKIEKLSKENPHCFLKLKKAGHARI